MKAMKVWGGSLGNHWPKILGNADACRLIVKAHSKAEAIRVLAECTPRAPSTGDFNHFYAESGNTLDHALCGSGDWVTVWVYNDDVCLRIYDERNPKPAKAGLR